MKVEAEMIRQIMHQVVCTHDDEMDCQACFEHVDQFVELELQGKDSSEIMTLVKAHLERCRECREEYEALLEAVRAMQD